VVAGLSIRPLRPRRGHRRPHRSIGGNAGAAVQRAPLSRGDYWLTFTTASVAGKEAANGLNRVGLPYIVVAAFWLVVLVVILVAWRASGETMSASNVCAGRQELFYWSAAGSGFALSQAVGHASVEFGFTYLRGELAVVAALTMVVAVAWWRFGLNPVMAFWLAFVLTYPLGGGVASWLAAGRSMGGLGLGHWPVSMSLAIAALGLVAYVAATGRETCELEAAVSAADRSTAGGREG
jgi:uncharacterized membrane-anchored protein